MNIHSRHLRSKGWSEEEIRHTKKIVSRIQKVKHPHEKLLLDIVYYTIIFSLAMVMIGFAFWLIPLLVSAPAILLYPVLLIIAFSFGTLLTHVFRDMNHLRFHHHAIVTAIVPLSGIISFATVIFQTNRLVVIGGFSHNPWLVGVIFTLAFLAPYLHYLWRLR